MRDEHDVPLASLTTMRVGGPAARLVTAETIDEVVDAVREVDDADEPLLVLGGGSNLVIADAGFAGSVVRMATDGIAVESADLCGGVMVRVARRRRSGTSSSRAPSREGWSGVEALSGIPGSTGATPVQNVGAYGQEVAQTIASVRVWDRAQQQVRTLSLAGLRLHLPALGLQGVARATSCSTCSSSSIPSELSQPVGYADLARQLGVEVGRAGAAGRRPRGGAGAAPQPRHGARPGRPRHLVVRVVLHQPDPVRPAVRGPRVARGHRLGPDAPTPPRFADPDGNVKTSAAWLIDQAGFAKGFALPGSGAALSTKHTLAVTNRGGATACRRRRTRPAPAARRARRVRRHPGQRAGVRRPRALSRRARCQGSAGRALTVGTSFKIRAGRARSGGGVASQASMSARAALADVGRGARRP